METKAGVDLHMETSEGGLKELVLRWFTETQAPLVNGNGNFPDWFQGFAARKEAEDLLRDKPLGSFLIRLSDKAVGYILSYKGHDRCRHFVITQNQDGQFVIAGDSQTFGSLTELIEHYRVSPILPFGEYLTSSCREENEGALYDVVNYNPRVKPGVSVQALRSLWDQKQDHQSHGDNTQRIQPRHDLPAAPPPAPPPALPLKSKSRKLTGTVSADAMTLSQVVPPVPKRGLPLGFSLSGSLPETTSHPSETQTDSLRSDRLNGNPDRDSLSGPDSSYAGDLSLPGNMYSELIRAESRSKSLPKLNNNKQDEEEEEEEEEEEDKEEKEKEVKEKEENSNRLSSFSFTSHSPSPLRRVTCHTYSLHDPRDGPRPSGARSELQADDLEMLRFNPLYQTSEAPGGGGSAPRGGAMYAEVPRRPSPAALPDDTYEQIPGEAAAAVQGNTYESLEDLKTKKSKSTWGKNNINWKKFLPDYKKK